MSEELKTVLLRSGALTSGALSRSLGIAQARNVSLWEVLVLERQVPEETLADAFSACLNVPRVRLDRVTVEAAVLGVITARIARKHTCLPIRMHGRVLVLAMANPLDREAIKDVEFAASRTVRPVVACRSEILTSIQRHYNRLESGRGTSPEPGRGTSPEPGRGAGPEAGRGASPEPGRGAGPEAGRGASPEPGRGADGRDAENGRPDDSPSAAIGGEFEPPAAASRDRAVLDPSHAVELCTRIILDAVAAGASDIHVEPGPVEMGVRLRVDGVLREHLRLPGWMHGALMSRIKVLAKLDIAQQRLPQDGRIRMDAQGRAIDFRVSTLPTHLGEKAVLRILGSANIPSLGGLGLSRAEVERLDAALWQPQGLILVTGPTGAGKSTTLYSMLTRRHSPEVNVVTIEDPIEYRVPGTIQVQVDPKAGLTFAGSLRAILRQDPDVILVGEIRDAETAEVAFQAALTGHLVFTTLHTNDAIGAIERLRDLSVKPLLLTSATNLIVAQRLARRVCTHCAERYAPAADVLHRLRIGPDDHAFTRGRGCDACAQTGYSGRVGIFEILRLTPRVRDLIARQAPDAQLRRAAASAGTRFLMDDALAKARQGLTTVEEILRVIRTEHHAHVRPPRRRKPALLPAPAPVTLRAE